jgi:3-phenylpropionate/trans-cinnamate dioxygenase ferredoxin reductase subunit
VTEDPRVASGEGVVIVGGGLAAQRCAEGLRRGGYEGRLRIVCGERHRPYDRPPLSKELLAEDDRELPAFRPPEWYEEKAVELILGARACGLDVQARSVELDDGREVGYDELVIATGARPRRLPLFEGYANVSTLRSVEDARAIRALIAHHRRIVVIGAGFIGQEVAAAARAAEAEVVVIELETLPLVGLLGPEIGRWFAAWHRAHGVELVLEQHVSAVRGEGTIASLTLADGRSVGCDHVLVGVGVVPDVGWLAGAGLPAEGIPADALGRTALPGVYAAGDAAATFDPVLERHALSGHWEAASRQGLQVASTILGREPGAPYPASFWSDQYGLRLQYLGHAQLADSLTVEGNPAANDFVARYERAGRLVGALVVGRPRAVAELRDELIQTNQRTPA